MHFLSLSPSLRWRLGVAATDCDDAMLPVGDERRRSEHVDVELLSDVRGCSKRAS